MLHLIDSAVILNNAQFAFDPKEDYLTTSGVVSEIRDFRSKAVVDNAFRHRWLRIEEPSEKTLGKIRNEAREIGMGLSETDISLVALAFEYRERKERIIVITDDYSVQNILLKLNIPFCSIIRGEIRKFRKKD